MQNVPGRFPEIVEAIADLLGPITKALAAGESFQGAWKAPGLWRGNHASNTWMAIPERFGGDGARAVLTLADVGRQLVCTYKYE